MKVNEVKAYRTGIMDGYCGNTPNENPYSKSQNKAYIKGYKKGVKIYKKALSGQTK